MGVGEGGFQAAPAPPGGWPPTPWDHAWSRRPDGTTARVAVDLDGVPIVDADGDMVMTGPGFAHRPVKATWLLGAPAVPTEFEVLTDEGRSCLDAAYEVSLDHGHPWVGTEHLVLAILLRHPELAARFALPDPSDIEAAVARFYEGSSWEGRLERVAARRAGTLPRPPSDGPDWNMALGTTVRTAGALAESSGTGLAGPVHLLAAELRSSRALVLSVLGREGRDVSETLRRASTTREWLSLISAVEEAEGSEGER